MQIKNKLLRLKKVYIYFTSYVLLIIFFSTTFLYANTFKVSDIDISAPYKLSFNKNKVINVGFKAAFKDLTSMITTSGDREKIKNTTLNELKSMIESFTISNERFINDEYFAKLEVTFNKKKILTFLEKKNIFPSIAKKNKILLIPILVDTEIDAIYLFTENPFFKKWNDSNENYYLLNYLLPSEDLEDLNIIQSNFSSIENYDFIDLVKKYALEDYIVSIIYKNKNELNILSKINFKDVLKIDNQKIKNIDLNNDENLAFVLNKLKTTYENYWKKNNEINTSIKLPLTVSINSKEYSKIKELKETFNELDLISSYYILKFDNQKIFFRIIYNGSPKTFLNDMSKKGFNFISENNIWNVK